MRGLILMVEDNPDDVLLVQRQFHYANLKYALHIVADGREALDYLNGKGRYSDRNSFPRPCLIILDLKIPGVDGFGLIEWARKNGETKGMPIIVYSGSVSPEDAQRAYALGANAYFAKLTGPGHYNLLFTAIQEFCDKPL